jgi:beta-lactamase class A
MHYEYIYDQRRFENKSDRKKFRRAKLFVWFVVFLILVYYTLGFFIQVFRNKNSVTIVSPLTEPLSASVDTLKEVINPSRLPQVVNNSLKGTAGFYAVVVKNLKNEETYSLNENRKFDSASLYKLWVMAEAFKLKEEGKIDFNKRLQYKIEELNRRFDIASESAELAEGDFDMTVSNALNQMITISHNYSALALTADIGLSKVRDFLKSNNLRGSSVGDVPQTTAADIALFYEMLYKGKLGNADATKQMLDLLKAQQLNDRIPKYLPEGVEVGHKTGELDFVKHDAGIVFTPRGDYIIVIMSESNDPKGAAEREALLSKAVYEYFELK